MFIAHLPAAYITSCLLQKNLGSLNSKAFIIAGMIGGIFPDVDLFYFYLVDHHQHPHHSYITHYPVVWVSLMLICYLWYRLATEQFHAGLALIFTFNTCLHMIFDTVVGDIHWFAPFIDDAYVLFTVPNQFQPWWLNFILHWSFLLELIICFFAINLYVQRRNISD